MPTIQGLAFELDDEFRQRNRKHSAAERSNLAILIEMEGCKADALTVAQIGPKLILCDGYTTIAICEEKGIKPTGPRVIPFPDRQSVLEWIDRVQEGRRNLTPEEIASRAEKRRTRVEEARAEGKSLRTIADQENVSEAQVRRDLEASGAPPGAPDTKPKRVKGKDKKTYKASKSSGKSTPRSTSASTDPTSRTAGTDRFAARGLVGPAIDNGKPSGAIKCSACEGRGWITKETRDDLWNAIVEITGADSKVNGARIGKLCKLLLSADPPYSAADIRKLPGIVKQRWPKLDFSFHIGNLERYIGWVRAEAPKGTGLYDGIKEWLAERSK